MKAYMDFKSFFLSLALALPAFTAYALNDTSALVAVGATETSDGVAPLIVSSQDQGSTWSWVESINGQSIENIHTPIVDVSCNNKVCVAATLIRNIDNSPLLVSIDHGKSWSSLYGFDTKAGSMFNIQSTYCQTDKCLAVGMYMDYKGKINPLIVETDNSGTKLKQLHNLPYKSGSELLTKIACSNSHCLAVGYAHDDNNVPVLLYSTKEAGTQWQVVKKIQGLPEMTTPKIENLTCRKDICLASGTYRTPHNNLQQSLLLRSQDGGVSWSNIEVQGLDTMDEAQINGVHCTDTQCFAVGNYDDQQSGTSLPLIILSDGKRTLLNKKIIQLPNSFKNSQLLKVSCGNESCVAVGRYDTEKVSNLPLIVISEDQGATWKFTSNIAGLVEEGLLLNALKCDKNTCIAAGRASEDSNRPSILMSHDGGQTWQQVTQFINTPSYIKATQVFSISNVSSASTTMAKAFAQKIKKRAN